MEKYICPLRNECECKCNEHSKPHIPVHACSRTINPNCMREMCVVYNEEDEEGKSVSLLNYGEQLVMNSLSDAWNKFVLLPHAHPDEQGEFRHAIHACQHIIMARPVQREYNKGDDIKNVGEIKSCENFETKGTVR